MCPCFSCIPKKETCCFPQPTRNFNVRRRRENNGSKYRGASYCTSMMYTEYESRAASYLMNHLYLATIYLLTIPPPSPHQSPSPHRTASFDGVKPQPILSIFGAYPIRECTTTIMILHASMWGDNNEPWMGEGWSRDWLVTWPLYALCWVVSVSYAAVLVIALLLEQFLWGNYSFHAFHLIT